ALILSDSTNKVAAFDRPSGVRRSISGFPFLKSNMVLASLAVLSNSNVDRRSIASVRQRNRFAGFHHAQLGFDLALFQFALEFFGGAGQHWKGAVVDWHDAARIHRFHRISGTDWSHGEMIADAYQHDIDLVIIGDARDVGEARRVAGARNGWAVANGDHESAWV